MGRGTPDCFRFAVLLAALAGGPARAVEPWADPSLPVTQGLAVWLDAARLNAARAAAGLPPLAGGAAADRWPDASGHGLHLGQPDAAARPTFQDTNGFRALRF